MTIPVSFSLSPKWIKAMTEFRRKPKIATEYFGPETLEAKHMEMYMEGYKTSPVKDTSYKGLWKVSFTLRKF